MFFFLPNIIIMIKLRRILIGTYTIILKCGRNRVIACALVGNSPGKSLIRVFCRILNSINAGNFTEC